MERREAAEEDLPFLIRRAQAGDPDAFERLVREYRDRIFRWALVRTGDVDDAEDATQEALVRVHRGLRKYRGESRFETWLYSVTRSAAADITRRRKGTRNMKARFSRLAESGSTADSAGLLDRVAARQLAEHVRGFLEQLPPRQREAVDLVDLQGLEPGEAAALLGSNPATLRTHLFRGRRALRCRLLDLSPTEDAT